MTEQWKDIPGYEGLYEISDLGRVRRVWKRKTRPVALVRSAQHGMFVKLSRNNCKKTFRLARLMLTVWHPINNPDLHITKFRNEDRFDCRASNLYWQLWIDPCHKAKLTADQVREIRSLWLTTDMTYREIAARYPVSRTAIGAIINGKSWKHLKREEVSHGQ
jgi:hypothetical protein